jgi:6-pyruvoyl-tetrahydropterin synthase
MRLFVEHLTVIDSAYLHPEHGIVGESWIVDVTLHGDLDPHSMVMDFGHVKKQLKAAIDGSIDHTLIVPAEAASLTLQREGDVVTLAYGFGDGESLTHRSPAQALTLLPAREVCDAKLTDWLEAMLLTVTPANVQRVEITLRHEDPAAVHYHYAHGLKKHDGNCQRIAHGHRSRLQIWRSDARDEAAERAWARDWDYAYIATLADKIGERGTQSEFGYTSDQGAFFLSYPTARVRLLPTDTTVECIAQHIAQTLGATVRAYEGVHKGAVASA